MPNMDWDAKRGALIAFNNAAQSVVGCETRLQQEMLKYEKAKKDFDKARNLVMTFLPEMATGFTADETVAFVDGKVQVVPSD